MSLKSSYDYIIVGGGLAGLLLGWELNKRNKSFVIFSNNQPASSSVAAGTWNPITFRKMIPTWRAQEMIDKMLEVYSEIETVLDTQLLKMIDVEKVLANEQEILSLIDAKNFDEVISFGKNLGKLIIITRGDKGSIAIDKNDVVQCDIQKNLKEETREILEKNIWRLGNLTLLERIPNSTAGNKSVKQKFEENTFGNSNILLSRLMQVRNFSGDVSAKNPKGKHATVLRKYKIKPTELSDGQYFGLNQMEQRESYMFSILSSFFGVELKTINF